MWKINRWIIDKIRSIDKFGVVTIDEKNLSYHLGPRFKKDR